MSNTNSTTKSTDMPLLRSLQAFMKSDVKSEKAAGESLKKEMIAANEKFGK